MKSERSDCKCKPCRVCGYTHSCNLMVEHKTTYRVGNRCPAKIVKVRRAALRGEGEK